VWGLADTIYSTLTATTVVMTTISSTSNSASPNRNV